MTSKEDSSGQVVMALGGFYFKASSTEQRWFWAKYKNSNISMYWGTQISTLDMGVYKRVRQDIIDKLGDAALKYIKETKIKCY